MASTLAGAILNTILDPVFIFVCRWGMMGAAVATVLGQIVTAVLAIWYLCNMRVIRPGKGDFKLSGGLCRRILSLGMTSFLSQISLVAAMAAINNMLRKYGALDPIFGQAQYAQLSLIHILCVRAAQTSAWVSRALRARTAAQKKSRWALCTLR